MSAPEKHLTIGLFPNGWCLKQVFSGSCESQIKYWTNLIMWIISCANLGGECRLVCGWITQIQLMVFTGDPERARAPTLIFRSSGWKRRTKEDALFHVSWVEWELQKSLLLLSNEVQRGFPGFLNSFPERGAWGQLDLILAADCQWFKFWNFFLQFLMMADQINLYKN